MLRHTLSDVLSKLFNRVVLVAAALTSPLLMAGELNITAVFRPDSSNPSNNKFINTTPPNGHSYCTNYAHLCPEGMFSINLPLTLVTSAPIQANHSDPRMGLMVKVPAQEMNLTVVSDRTGAMRELRFKIIAFGSIKMFAPDVGKITGISDFWAAHAALWEGGTWSGNPPAPCQYVGPGGTGWSMINFFMKTPSSSICAKKALFEIPKITMTDLDIAYELVTPDPLSMESGTYTSVTPIIYSIGPGKDFDFGDVMIASDSLIAINFILSVEHALKVQFPPGADRLSLIPDGGWQQWLHRGRRPEKLFANQPFQIWSSGRFNMQLQCQYTVGEHCGIQNQSGHMVPVETRVTLPAGITALSGMAVNRQLLSNTNATTFFPSHYVDNGRASLHFEVGRDSVKEMTEHAGSRYSGNVTIIWDSQVDG